MDALKKRCSEKCHKIHRKKFAMKAFSESLLKKHSIFSTYFPLNIAKVFRSKYCNSVQPSFFGEQVCANICKVV